MTLGQYKVYVVMAFLVASSWLLAGLFDEQDVVIKTVVDHSPDYFSVGYYKKEMTPQGLIDNELVAKKMTHYADDGTTHLESPVMTLYNPALPPWVIKSETGVLQADGDHLFLSGSVFISRAASETRKLFKVNTSELNVQLSISHAETTQWAEIIDGSNRTVGVGMKAVFKNPVKVKFLSKVKGRYVFN